MTFKDNAGSPESSVSNIDIALQQYKHSTNKRKRDPSDPDGDSRQPGSKRSSTNNINGNGHDNNDMSHSIYPDNPSADGPQDFATLSHQIAQHVAQSNNNSNLQNNSNAAAAALAGMLPQLTVPQPTELSFVSSQSGTDVERQLDSSFDLGGDNGQNHNVQNNPYGMGGFHGPAGPPQGHRESSNGAKPAVGSEEWHKVRRDNHKEGKHNSFARIYWIHDDTYLALPVERRRRETINEGINELAKIVPGCEKNKGSILQRAVQYITQLRESESKNIEKWTLEKMLTDQAMAELTDSVVKLKEQLDHAWNDVHRLETINRARDLADSGNNLKPQQQQLQQQQQQTVQLGGDDDAGGTDDDGET